jgi:molecular chaperone DnaJ
VLGVSADASQEAIRAAYRDRARVAHPDRGAPTTESMVAINEAYRVLADPGRRAVYDRSLRAPSTEVDDSDDEVFERIVVDKPSVLAPAGPARFPWKLMLVVAAVGSAVVVVSSLFDDPPGTETPDGILRPGSCVSFEANGDAREVPCEGDGNDAVVKVLVPLDGTCPGDTVGHRDRLGLGIACVAT